MKTPAALALPFALTLAAPVARAQTNGFAVTPFVVAGGGGASAGGGFKVEGTAGQADTGNMGGGGFLLEGGYWSLVQIVAEPGAALLTLTRAGGQFTLSWPLNTNGFILEEAASLTLPVSWSTVPGSYSSNATDFFLTLPAAPGNRFYRLHKP
ncbi:MAG: hypothetical protein HY301_09305 [Verrucomicrobia bacterium]|nr:hypothetical protein [Verrucomicrobiota bacterium]